jgi:glycosyltransferase involved in cell wall biosynthesis
VPFKISVVVPTRNRRALLRACLDSLARQTLPRDAYEVVVVDDGSTDDTPEFLGRYAPGYAFRHVAQEHGGLSAARNTGNRAAGAELILCLDDDMRAAPGLLEEHVKAHDRHPGCLIQGALRIDASVKRRPFVAYQERLLEAIRRERAGAYVMLHGEEISGGNISVRKDVLDAVGGFNEELKRMRNTDGELALRLEQRGVAIRYAAGALAAMTHVNDLDAALDASFLYGRSYAFTQQVFPGAVWKLSPLAVDRRSLLRNLARRLFFLKRPRATEVLVGLARTVVRVTEALHLPPLSAALYRLALDGRFWKGVHVESDGQVSRYRPRGIPILCFHNVSDVRNRPFRRYILPVERFRRQIAWLQRRGYRAISLDSLHDYLDHGAALPAKPVVITFDDGYRELETTATPILAAAGFPHTHFINSGKIGGTTDWIAVAPDLPILSAQQIRRMAQEYEGLVDFQAHGRGHLFMPRHDRETVADEVRHCIEVLEPLTGRAVRHLAYPFGEQDAGTREALRGLPIRCAFTVDQGLCRPGQDRHRLPRVEIFTHDLAVDFRFKLRFGWSPIAASRRRLKRVYKKVMRRTGLRGSV